MIFLYLKSALRNAQKNSTMSFAKLFGIGISFAVILFSMAYVYHETRFDKCVPDYDKKYRCLTQGKLKGRVADFAVTSPKMAQTLVDEIPEITKAIRILPRGNASFKYNEQLLEEGELLYADPGFFSFFGIPVKEASPNPLEAENNALISKSLVNKHFGTVEEALNRKIEVRGDECLISGVFDDFPANFHLKADIIQSIKKINPEEGSWDNQYLYTYIQTSDSNIDNDELSFKVSKTAYTHHDQVIDGSKAKTWDDLKHDNQNHLLYKVEPLTDIHFSNHKFDPAVTSNKTYVYGAIIFSILILLISSVNYINLSIANFSTRFKEIGVRKTTGARSKQITWQFLYESLFFLLTGFFIALLLYEFGGMHLSQYLGFDISITQDRLLGIFEISLIVLILFHIFTIVFPIVYFSGKKVLHLMQGDQPGRRHFSLRGSLVIVQFGLSALIILSSFIVQKQISFMLHKDRGYDTENVIMLRLWNLELSERQAFIKELESYPMIKSVSTSDNYFGEAPGMSSASFRTEENVEGFHTSAFRVDADFFNTFNFRIHQGRFFQKDKNVDDHSVVLNETAVKEYSGQDSLIGEELSIYGETYNIIGIVKDFNFRPLYHPIQPLVILPARQGEYGGIFVKVNQNQAHKAIDILREQWKKFNISSPFQYSFHDELLASQYAKDRRMKKLLLFLSIISICIACVGLYAISLFITIRKTKEIGIRKVNGAKSLQILGFLNIKLLKWIGMAFLVASPIAWYAMNQWLQNFAYRTELSWWIFALAGVIVLGIAFLTVSWQSWRAARRNPVESLRYE